MSLQRLRKAGRKPTPAALKNTGFSRRSTNGKNCWFGAFGGLGFNRDTPTRWAPTSYKWSYKPYKWPYK